MGSFLYGSVVVGALVAPHWWHMKWLLQPLGLGCANICYVSSPALRQKLVSSAPRASKFRVRCCELAAHEKGYQGPGCL